MTDVPDAGQHVKESGCLSSALLPLPAPCSDDGGGCEKMGVDEMLRRHAGEFGPWQLRQFALTSLAWALNAFHTMVVVFADREPTWRCTGLAAGACPKTTCGLGPEEWEWAGGREASTVSEWGLLCGHRYKVGLAQSAFFAGSLVGAGIFGHLSDSVLGRKGTLTVASAMSAAFGLLTSIAPSFPFYAALRFLTGLGTGGVGLSAFVLATEPVGPAKRAAVAMSTFYFFSVGTVLLSVAAFFLTSWRALYAAASLPSLLFVTAVLPFVSESPRWYLVHRDTTRAMDVMRSIAKANGKHLPDGVSLILDCDDSRSSDQQATGSIVDAVRSPVTRTRLALTVAINLLCSVAYYGLSLNVANLSTELHVSVVLNAVAEVPAYALTAASLKWYGRRPLTAGTMWLGAVFCAAGSVLVDAGAMRVVRTGCGVVGIFAATATFNLLFIYTAELFPTAVRNAALGCVSQAGQAGAVVAPLVVVLGGNWPFTVFGACGVVGGMLALYLPETLDRPFYDTLAGMEGGEVEKGGG